MSRLADVHESLISLGLIKRDRTTQEISLHRLVQTQFRYYMAEVQQQETFALASTLLLAAFPTKPRGSHQMYNVWSICQRYLQHILFLMRHYEEASRKAEPLTPTKDFCTLLVHCLRSEPLC